MTPLRPYLLKSLYEWILANDELPYLVINSKISGVQVPLEYADKDTGIIILNIAPAAVENLVLGQRVVHFKSRFKTLGQYQCIVPIHAVEGIYPGKGDASQGYYFSEDDLGLDFDPPMPQEIQKEVGQVFKKPHLTLVDTQKE